MNNVPTPTKESHYQRILEVSQQMLDAGLAQEWERLLSLEKQRQLLWQTMPTQASTEQDHIIDLIHQIQNKDLLLQEKVEAWLAHARILLRMPPRTAP